MPVICPFQGCKKSYVTDGRLQKHYSRKHGIPPPDDDSGARVEKGQKRRTTEDRRTEKKKKARKTRPKPGDITSSVFDVVDLRTPSPLHSPTPTPTPGKYTTPRPTFSHALSPDSDHSSPERDILQTPANGLPPIVRVAGTRPTWVSNTPPPAIKPTSKVTPTIAAKLHEPTNMMKKPGVSKALLDTGSSDDEMVDVDVDLEVSPFDVLGKTFGGIGFKPRSESVGSAVDQLAQESEEEAKEMDEDVIEEEDGGQDDHEREETPCPVRPQRASILVTKNSCSTLEKDTMKHGPSLEEQATDHGPTLRDQPTTRPLVLEAPTVATTTRRRSPVLGPAFDMFLPELRAQSADTSTNFPLSTLTCSKIKDDVAGDLTAQTAYKGLPIDHMPENKVMNPKTHMTLTKPHPHGSDLSRILKSTPCSSSATLVNEILNPNSSPGPSTHQSPIHTHAHTLCPCMLLDIIARLASTAHGACEGCQVDARAHEYGAV